MSLAAVYLDRLLGQGFTTRKLESLLGLSRGYLQRARRKEPSRTLLAALALLAEDPAGGTLVLQSLRDSEAGPTATPLLEEAVHRALAETGARWCVTGPRALAVYGVPAPEMSPEVMCEEAGKDAFTALRRQGFTVVALRAETFHIVDSDGDRMSLVVACWEPAVSAVHHPIELPLVDGDALPLIAPEFLTANLLLTPSPRARELALCLLSTNPSLSSSVAAVLDALADVERPADRWLVSQRFDVDGARRRLREQERGARGDDG